MFHNWASTDADTLVLDADTILDEARCYQCGVTAPEWASGPPYFVTVDHGCLPIACPGPGVRNAHLFTATGGADEPIRCEWCGYEVGGDDAPDGVDWECHGQE